MPSQAKEAQQEIVASQPVIARLLVLAGPGTGKTETVAKRLTYFVGDGVKPAQILVLSFSRSAVKTLTRRLENYISESPDQFDELRHLSIRTFDSWSFRMLRLLGNAPRELLQRSYNANIAALIGEIQTENGSRVRDLLQTIRHVIVDEFQDLSGVRGALVLELLKLLSPPGSSRIGFTVLGDQAQAIYGFAARQDEDPEFSSLTASVLLGQLRSTYGESLQAVEFKKNHRSTEKLTTMTQALRNILSSPISGEKKLEAMQKIAGKIPALEGDLTPEIIYPKAGESTAILTRTNGEVLRVAQKLIPYDATSPAIAVSARMTGRPVGVPPWIGLLLGPVKSSLIKRSQFRNMYDHVFGKNAEGVREAVGVPAEADAWSSLSYATDAMKTSDTVDLGVLRERLGWTDLMPDDVGEAQTGIQVMTIHQSKGMEFDSVWMMEPSTDQPSTDPEEAANVIFVGISRAGMQLRRIPDGSTYKPLSSWTFQDGKRRRWGAWVKKWVNLEIGIPGDIDPAGFVDPVLHGSIEAVRATQEIFASRAHTLRGQKVMLCRRASQEGPGKLVYGIHLQDGNEPGRILGEMTNQITFDLLQVLYSKGYVLPQKIFNLRIAEVVTTTVTGASRRKIADDWEQSRLWLGLNLFGTGDFQLWKRT